MGWIDSGSGPGYTSPIPPDVVRAQMRSVLLRHRIDGGVCRSCGETPGPDGLCWAGRVASQAIDDRTG